MLIILSLLSILSISIISLASRDSALSFNFLIDNNITDLGNEISIIDLLDLL